MALALQDCAGFVRDEIPGSCRALAEQRKVLAMRVDQDAGWIASARFSGQTERGVAAERLGRQILMTVVIGASRSGGKNCGRAPWSAGGARRC